MKKSLAVVMAMILLAGCTKTVIVNKKPLPPGQAKKVVGAKSASSFTPAAQKKSANPPVKGGKKK